jgi:hypothetical protein
MREKPRSELADIMSDFATDTAASIKVMSAPAKFSFGVGFLGFVIFEIFQPVAIPPTLLAALRTVCFAAFIFGAVANARSLDDFYRSVHLYACAIALPISAILIYTTAVFDINLGRPTIAYIVAIWFVSFVYAFVRLRQA